VLVDYFSLGTRSTGAYRNKPLCRIPFNQRGSLFLQACQPCLSNAMIFDSRALSVALVAWAKAAGDVPGSSCLHSSSSTNVTIMFT
jgi:hypothetical protein